MRSVYIADDSQEVRERLIAMISELEGIVLAGDSGEPREAVMASRRLQPDAVILDVKCPGMSGIHVLKEIKQSLLPPVVIMLANYPFGQYRRQCAEAGADYCLIKSMEIERIYDLLKKIDLVDSQTGN